MNKRKKGKIALGFILAVLLFLVLSFLSGSDWVMSALLYFSNDVLCEDMNHDGVDDFCQYWNNGLLIKTEWDTDYDGNVDVWQENHESGETFRMDSNYDGVVDYDERILPDGRHQAQIDTDFDGAFDQTKILEPSAPTSPQSEE